MTTARRLKKKKGNRMKLYRVFTFNHEEELSFCALETGQGKKKTIFSNGSLYFLKDWLSMKKEK